VALIVSQAAPARPAPGLIDFDCVRANNAAMARPETVRRVKSYSAATGYVYQYYFYEVQKARRGFASGTEYVYMVSANREKVFPVRIFVRREAVENWGKTVGREMTSTEEYAVAKMCLFQGFDELEDLASRQPDLIVDESNLESLLAQLGI
jgi:hypothetical protein